MKNRANSGNSRPAPYGTGQDNPELNDVPSGASKCVETIYPIPRSFMRSGNKIVQTFWQQKGICKKKVRGSSPRGGARLFLLELSLVFNE